MQAKQVGKIDQPAEGAAFSGDEGHDDVGGQGWREGVKAAGTKGVVDEGEACDEGVEVAGC